MSDGVTRALTADEFAAKMEERGMNVKGQELPDPVPFKPIAKVARQPSMFDIHRMRVAEARMLAQIDGDESPDEMMDMGDGDEELIERLSEYEEADLQIVLAQAEARRKSSESEQQPEPPSGNERQAGSQGDVKPDSDPPVDPAKKPVDPAKKPVDPAKK